MACEEEVTVASAELEGPEEPQGLSHSAALPGLTQGLGAGRPAVGYRQLRVLVLPLTLVGLDFRKRPVGSPVWGSGHH